MIDSDNNKPYGSSQHLLRTIYQPIGLLCEIVPYSTLGAFEVVRSLSHLWIPIDTQIHSSVFRARVPSRKQFLPKRLSSVANNIYPS